MSQNSNVTDSADRSYTLSQPSTISSSGSFEIPNNEYVALLLLGNREMAQAVLDKLSYKNKGWCKIVDLSPTKPGGYVQISAMGANKVLVLQEVAAAAGGQYRSEENAQVSHRFHQPKCKVPDHMCIESSVLNNQRKGCLVWIKCPCCNEILWVCTHEPPCIKFDARFQNVEEIRAIAYSVLPNIISP
jgi:hypothetical protein